MRLLTICATAFVCGVILASCGTPATGATCRVTGVDTLWIFSASGDSLPAIITTEWCE